VKDPLSGYFALRRDVFERLRDRVSTDGWKILLELLAADPGPEGRRSRLRLPPAAPRPQQDAARGRPRVARRARPLAEGPRRVAPSRALEPGLVRSRPNWTVFGWTALPLVALYAATAAPTVTGEDSGELITAAHQLAVAHPPGYPLWLLLTKAFQFLFSGVSVAHASALASGVTTAAACGLVSGRRRRPARARRAPRRSSSAFLSGLVHEIWNHATIAEVYPLALLLFVAGILQLLRWREEPTLRRWFVLTLVLGTGVAHHPLLLLFGPVFAIAAVAAHPRVALHWKSALVAVLGLALPFLVYLQAWYAAAHEPALSWGLKPELASLAAHWNREVYGLGPAKTARTLAKLGAQFAALGRFVVDNLTLPGALLALVGVAHGLRRGDFAARVVAALALVGAPILLVVLPFDLEREELFAARVFFMPAYLCLALAAGSAVRAALDRLSDTARPRLALATLLAPLALAITGFSAHDRSDYRWSEDYGRAILDGCPQDALLFPGGDTSTFPLLYLQYVEGHRKDVRILDRSGTVERAEALALLPESERPAAAVAPREELLAILARKSGKPVVSLRPERRDEDLASVPCGLGLRLPRRQRQEVGRVGAEAPDRLPRRAETPQRVAADRRRLHRRPDPQPSRAGPRRRGLRPRPTRRRRAPLRRRRLRRPRDQGDLQQRRLPARRPRRVRPRRRPAPRSARRPRRLRLGAAEPLDGPPRPRPSGRRAWPSPPRASGSTRAIRSCSKRRSAPPKRSTTAAP
jgi:hypothetical protein